MWRSIFVITLFTTCVAVAKAAGQIPFLPRNKYTPLLFFKTPHGASPENDALEKVVSEVEKELGVKVQRMDVIRDPMVRKTYGMLSATMPPMLYHRESRQVISIPSKDPTASEDQDEEESPTAASQVHIDKDRVRAWAKGRYLPPLERERNLGGLSMVVSDDSQATDQQELLEDQQLTPVQREGKEAIRRRTEEKAKERKARVR